MSAWSESLKSNAIWSRLKDLGQAIVDAENREEVPAKDLDDLARLRACLTFVGKRFETADAYLIVASQLEGVSDPLASCLANVTSYIADGNASHLNDANTHMDQALRSLASTVFPISLADIKGIRVATDDYRATVTARLREFDERAATQRAAMGELLAGVTDLKGTVEAETVRARQVFADFDAKFTAAEDARATEHKAAEAARAQRWDTTFTEFQNQFSVAQGARETTHADAQNKRQERFDTLLADYQQKLSERSLEFERQAEKAASDHATASIELHAKYVELADAILKGIEEKRAQVEALVGVIGELGVTSGHKKVADKAHGQVRVWQLVTVGGLVILLMLAALTAFSVVEHTFTWGAFAERVYLSIAAGLLSIFGASQVGRYQSVETRNRKLELDLKALGPFLEPLTPEKREAFRVKIGELAFGRDDPIPGQRSPTTLFELLKSKEFKELITLMNQLRVK